jgi:hypothetical protein
MINFDFTVAVIFFISFIFLILVGLFIFSVFKNKIGQKEVDYFLESQRNNDSNCLTNLQMVYEEGNNLKSRISPFDECDIYIFEYYIALLRRQRFIFKFIYKPTFICFDKSKLLNCKNNIDFIFPDKIGFNKFRKNLFEIKFTDKQHKNFKTEIRIKNLTTKQINSLSVVQQK